jgi:HEAT repeat protein
MDENSRVRRTALRVLGELGDPGLIPFFQNRFAEDDSYVAQAEALRSIGRVGDERHLPFLRDALEVPSHQDVIRQAAEWSIAEISRGR